MTKPLLDPKLDYFIETFLPGATHRTVFSVLAVEERLFEGRTEFQHVDVFRNADFGVVLALDGVIQLSESDEFVYHEMLVHPVLLAHPAPKRVLIVGGGDGGSLRECLKHDPDEVVIVEIDPQVIELSRRYLPFTAGECFADPRVTVLIEDGARAIQRYPGHFDAIIVDSADDVGPATVLFQEPFYRDVAGALAPGGVAAFQVGSFMELDLPRRVASRLRSVFRFWCPHRFTMPVYNDGDYCFLAASPDVDLDAVPQDLLAQRLSRIVGASDLKYYSPAVHKASQVLPPVYELREKAVARSG